MVILLSKLYMQIAFTALEEGGAIREKKAEMEGQSSCVSYLKPNVRGKKEV